MHLHQILTGAANASDYSFAAGSIDSVHFVVSHCSAPESPCTSHFSACKAYAAGYNIVILSGDFQRVQVLLSGNENNQCLLTCIDCTHLSGKVRSPRDRMFRRRVFFFSRLSPGSAIKCVSMSPQSLRNDRYIMFVDLLYFNRLISRLSASELSMGLDAYVNMFQREDHCRGLASERYYRLSISQ